MVDEVTSLQSHGVGTAILSGNEEVEKKLLEYESEVKTGKFKFLFTYPETVVGL